MLLDCFYIYFFSFSSSTCTSFSFFFLHYLYLLPSHHFLLSTSTGNEEVKSSESDIYFDDSPSIGPYNGHESTSSHLPSDDIVKYSPKPHFDFGPGKSFYSEDSDRPFKGINDQGDTGGESHHHLHHQHQHQQLGDELNDQGSAQPLPTSPSDSIDYGNRKSIKSDSLIAEPSHQSRHGSADQHGWLDMGAYSGKHGAFGWYADFPVGGIAATNGYAAAASSKQQSHHHPHPHPADGHSINGLG